MNLYSGSLLYKSVYNIIRFTVVACGFVLGLVSFSHASSASLAELESRLKDGASVAAEVAQLEELQAELDHQRQISGWKIISSARVGYTNEEQEDNNREEYSPVRVSTGLTYPLFGKYKEEQSRLLALESGAANEKLQVEIKRREALELLRLNYVLLWGMEQKEKLAKSFLNNSLFSREFLQKRKDRGQLLGSDYLDFLTILDRVAREERLYQNEAAQAREIIFVLTGVRLTPSLLHAPDLPMGFTHIDEALAQLTMNPEILFYQNRVDEQLQQLRYAGSDVKGNVSVEGFASSSEDVNAEMGYGGLVSLDIVMPINPFAAEDKSQLLAKKRLRRYQQELRLKVEEVRLTLLQRIRAFDSERFRKEENIRQLMAATEFLREKELRRQRLDGDVLEQHQKALYRYYRAAVEFIDGEIRLVQSRIRYLRFCPETKERQQLVNELTSVIKPLVEVDSGQETGATREALQRRDDKGSDTAVYLWKSSLLLEGQLTPSTFKNEGISKVLLSLDGTQLQRLSEPTFASHVRNILILYEKEGVSISLLLGEPTWILPEFRADLMKILRLSNQFDFETVHLDMEPSQLDVERYGYAYLTAQLLRTVQMADELSDHPIEISIHPRLLDSSITEFCFGCGLTNLNLAKVVVMMYRTDFDAVQQEMAGLTRVNPELSLALAQSVELESILGPKNSYGSPESRPAFQQMRLSLQDIDKSGGWTGDLYIQDWSSYAELFPFAEQYDNDKDRTP